MNSKKQSPEIWKALSNKIRRDLLCFIGEKRVVSFTEIQERFQMKVGTLYHHIDTLGELITQDSTKKYLLTEKGSRSYALIEDELDVSAPSLPTYGKVSFLHSVFLRPVFQFIAKDSIRSLGFSVLLLILLGISTYFLSFSPIFLFPSFIAPDYFAPIFFVVSTVVTYLLIELFISVIYKRKTGKLALFQSTIFAQIPLILFCLLEALVFDFEYPVSPLQMDIWVIVLLMFVQLIFVGLLTESIVVIKELRVEKAGLAILFVVFILNGLAFLVMSLLEVTL
ncbi:MAG: hypothetical protein KGD64_12985 [Candidatus Heimdallarchaeota archaeon]|nr:hypothetical protein [Candidatus Heimdallarchaeota archaeon]